MSATYESYVGQREPDWVEDAIDFYTKGDKPTLAEAARHVGKQSETVLLWFRRKGVVRHVAYPPRPAPKYREVEVCGCRRDYLTVPLDEPCCNPEIELRRV